MRVLKKIQKQLTTPNKLAVIGVFFSQDDRKRVSLALFERKKGKMELIMMRNSIEEMEIALSLIKEKSTPVCLCVDGKGILHRKLNFSLEDFDETQLGKIIPNARPEDFVFEQTRISETVSHISLMRITSIQPVFEKVEQSGFLLTSLHIGPAVIACMAPELCQDTDSVKVPYANYVLQLNADGLQEVDATGTGSEENKDLLLKAGAFSFFSGWNVHMSRMYCSYVEEKAQFFFERKKFSVLLFAGVLFFLVVLVSNFFVFQHYWDKQQTLQSEVGWQESALKNYDELKKNIAEKMTFAMESGLLSSNRLSAIADEIAAGVPQEISLSRMRLYPREKRMLEGEEHVYFDQQHVWLSGLASSGGVVEDWIRSLKQCSFSRKVQLIQYKKEDESGGGGFDIEITLK